MRNPTRRYLGLALLTGTLVLSGLSGCAPEEDNPGIISRPKAKITPTPVPTTPQASQEEIGGGIKNSGGTSSTVPTNPPAFEPTSLPTWSPSAPPSLKPIIVPPSSDPTDPEATPTPDMLDPSADPDAV